LAFVVMLLLTFYCYYAYMTWTRFLIQHLFGMCSAIGVTGGSHRLWAHRTFKARFPLRVLLMILHTFAGQNDIYIWSRDHRMHHKFVETDADPHTTTRGMFFAHMGWLMVKKHPDVVEKGKTLDCSDLLRDPVVVFQRKYYTPLSLLCVLVIPISVHMKMGCSLFEGLCLAMTRYLTLLHVAWCINSVAHSEGPRPYDGSIQPSESFFMRIFALGEGFHNYHHVFPFDYRASELNFTLCNLTTLFIDAMASIGQAYDLKHASPEAVSKRIAKSGDGTMYKNGWGLSA